jgi:DNA-binding transcriptional LysR family regulator
MRNVSETEMSETEEGRRRTRSTGPTVEQAQAFCAVADASSYKQAAANMGLSEHVTLVRLVSRFTKALNHGQLLEQESKGRVRLTAIGSRVLPAARAFVESDSELRELRPEIRFSAYPTIAGRMARECPELLEQEVPLVLKNISEANRQDGGWRLVHDVASGRLDMAIAPAHLPEERLTERPLYSWRLRVILPEDEESEPVRKLGRRKRVTPADIVNFRIAVAPAGHKSRELLRQAFEMADVNLKIALESPNQEFLQAVAQGGKQHVAVLPDDAFDAQGVKHAPSLYVRGSERKFGGEYALYMRRPEEPEDGEVVLSDQDKAIAAAAEELVNAFKK